MAIDEKALSAVQNAYADKSGKYRDMSIREIVEAYEAARQMEPEIFHWSERPGDKSYFFDSTINGKKKQEIKDLINRFIKISDFAIQHWKYGCIEIKTRSYIGNNIFS